MLTTYCAVTLCVTFEEQLEIVKLKPDNVKRQPET